MFEHDTLPEFLFLFPPSPIILWRHGDAIRENASRWMGARLKVFPN